MAVLHRFYCTFILVFNGFHIPYKKDMLVVLRVTFLKNLNTLLFEFSDNTLIIRAGIHKMLVRIANREDPDQTASEVQFSDNTLSIRNGIHKMLVRIANRGVSP